jgi:uncharacterized protein involved in type VI secretion and phage assembly
VTHFDALASLLPIPERDGGFFGVVVGVVTNNQDPDNLGRVKVKLPWLSEEDESHWARVLTPMAGNGRGLYFLPEVDDEVLVAFEHGRVEFPYVLGALWNGKDTPPESNEDGANNLRGITSRSGLVIRLDDAEGAERIEIADKDRKNVVVVDHAANSITITADADVTIQATSGKIALSGNGIEITSQAGITIEASAQLDLKGSMVNIN